MSAEVTAPAPVIPAKARNRFDVPSSRHSRESENPVTFARYPEYKDSGVVWLGEVPAHWGMAPMYLRYSIQLGKMLDTGKITGEYLTPYLRNVDVQWDSINIDDLPLMDILPDEQDRYTVRDGDLLVCEGGEVGRAAIVAGLTEPVAYQKALHRLRSESDEEAPRYIFYVFCWATPAGAFSGEGQSTISHLTGDQLRKYRFPKPPLIEQRIIAAFLDRETAKIDALIAEQEKLIALLKEKRQALISHAVTKGLDPHAPMKDSGIEWLGQVPAHWDVQPIKQIVSTPVTDGPHETPVFLDEGVPFVSAEAVSGGFLDFSKIRGYISDEDHERYAAKYQPRRGDIYMVKSGATTGMTAIVETDDQFDIWSPLAAIRCGKRMRPRFLLHVMRSRHFMDGVTLGWSFGTQQNIGMGVIENLSVPVPPQDEQREIQTILDRDESLVLALVDEANRAITLLGERRAALISAAVTGKIDVRNAS